MRRAAALPGADPDAEGRQRRTLLMFAVARHPALVPLLIELGADPNRRSSIGQLPLETALERRG